MNYNFVFTTPQTWVMWGAVITLLLLDSFSLLSKRVLKIGAFALVLFFIAFATFKSFAQWQAWSASPVGKSFLPPENTWYFTFYAFSHFYLPVIFTIFSTLVFAAALFFLEWQSQGKWLSRDDAWLGIVASLLVGWPGVLLLVLFTFAGMALASLAAAFISRSKTPRRVPFSPFLFGSLFSLLLFGRQFLDIFNLYVIRA